MFGKYVCMGAIRMMMKTLSMMRMISTNGSNENYHGSLDYDYDDEETKC